MRYNVSSRKYFTSQRSCAMTFSDNEIRVKSCRIKPGPGRTFARLSVAAEPLSPGWELHVAGVTSISVIVRHDSPIVSLTSRKCACMCAPSPRVGRNSNNSDTRSLRLARAGLTLWLRLITYRRAGISATRRFLPSFARRHN